MDCLNEGLDVIVVLNSLKTIDFPDDHVLSDESGGYLISYRNNGDVKDSTKRSNDNDISFKIDLPDIELEKPEIKIVTVPEDGLKRSPKKPSNIQIIKNREYEQEEVQKKSWNLEVKMNDFNYNEPTPTFQNDINDVLTWDDLPQNELILKEEEPERKNSEIAEFGDVSNIEKDSLPGGAGTYEELPTISRLQNSMDLSFSYCNEEVIKPIVKNNDTSVISENKQDISILPAHNETIILVPDPPTGKPISRARASIRLSTKPKQNLKSQVKLRQKSLKSVLTPQKNLKSPNKLISFSSKPQKSLKKTGQRSQSKHFTSLKDFSTTFNSTSSKHLNPVKFTNQKFLITNNHLTPMNPYMQELRKFSQNTFFPLKNLEDSFVVPKKPKKKRIIFF